MTKQLKVETNPVKPFIERMDGVAAPCVSVYLDTPGGGKDWRHHLKRLEGKFEGLGSEAEVRSRYGESTIDELISKARQAGSESSRWAGEYASVGFLFSPEYEHFAKSGVSVKEFEHVGEEFVIKRMVPTIASQFDGLVLHFTLKSPTLYRVSGGRLKRVAASQFPSSIYEMPEAEIVEEGRRAHSRESSPQGPAIVPHGVSGDDSVADRNMDGFVRDSVHVLKGLKGVKDLPLIVVAKEKIAAKFEEAYRNDAGATFIETTAPSPLDESEILEICAKWQRKQAELKNQEILDTLKSMDQNSSLFSDNLRELLEGAQQGRVEVCAVAADVDIWCRYDEVSRKLESVSESEYLTDPAVFEATDRIIKSVYATGGDCAVVPHSELESDKAVVGRLKW